MDVPSVSNLGPLDSLQAPSQAEAPASAEVPEATPEAPLPDTVTISPEAQAKAEAAENDEGGGSPFPEVPTTAD